MNRLVSVSFVRRVKRRIQIHCTIEPCTRSSSAGKHITILRIKENPYGNMAFSLVQHLAQRNIQIIIIIINMRPGTINVWYLSLKLIFYDFLQYSKFDRVFLDDICCNRDLVAGVYIMVSVMKIKFSIGHNRFSQMINNILITISLLCLKKN